MIAVMAFASSANASLFVVDAFANSSNGGSGVSTVSLTSGQNFTVTVALSDLWNAGELPRWSNADGLIVDLYATGLDDSGESSGTQIGTPFPLWTDLGLTAPYGSLVGEIGGIYQLIGSSFNGAAWATGTLNLYYWDSNNGDNTQFITADVETPEPAALALVGVTLLSLVGLALIRRRRDA